LFFEPGQVRGGRYRFDIGTAGSAPLVLQTVYLPLAFASGPSRFRTARVTRHLLTNAEVIRAFLPAQIQIEGVEGQPGTVTIQPIISRKP
jgi:RNA 3'-terminal phosphate cyclase (ATP)